MRWRTAFVTALLGGAAAGVVVDLWPLPERWNPWAPLRLADAPNLLTRFKLGRLDTDPIACRAALEQTPFDVQALADRRFAPGCEFNNAVRVRGMTVAVSAPFTLSCRAAVSLGLWERHVLLPAALRHFGEPAVRLEHWGSYACRDIGGREPGTRSRHASADALDIAAIGLASGRRIGVAGEWAGDGPDGRFLRELRDGACPWFDAVLSPDYNAAHADHLHLDRGPHRLCR